MEQDWFEELAEKPMDDITLEEFELLCANLFVQSKQIDTIEAALKEENAKLLEMKNRVQSILQKHNKSSYKSSFGTVYQSEIFQVTTPKTEEDKQALFEFLKSRGLYLTMVSVNSKTLQSFCKSEFEDCKENGNEFNIPGVKDPTFVKRLNLKRGK